MTSTSERDVFSLLQERLSPALEEVERRLTEQTRDDKGILTGLLSHLAQAGGKRLRPLLVLLCAQLGEPERATCEEVLDAAVVVELTHLATLYHDDVMDSAPSRRGVDTAHVVWSNNQAILAGDLLFSRASMLVADLGPKMVYQHAQTFERLCLGQLDETVGPAEGDDPIEHYLRVLADKTGSLVAQSARFGAELVGAHEEVVDALYRFGDDVGVAFQIADDVLDIASDHETSGKTPGTDLREGVDTLPILLLRRAEARGEIDEEGRDILALLGGDLSDDEALREVVERLRSHRVLASTRDLAHAWCARAKGHLSALPEGTVRQALEAFADALVDRVA
ncbi:MAG: polyprenyl synthetase family protein [Actinomycetaceae bacterium]|nr:polyprenyl synthetase family protein [Actinomycetaceae bacterium]